MNPLKVWFYPTAKPPEHDSYEWYANTVPFCKAGIEKWVQPCYKDTAEFLWLGQVSPVNRHDATWLFLKHGSARIKTIADIQGDFLPGSFMDEFQSCIRIACGAPFYWRVTNNVFPRPTMSRMLVEWARNSPDRWMVAPDSVRFGFIGKTDRASIRQKVAAAADLARIPGEIILKPEWNGPSEPHDQCRHDFMRNMVQSTIALCPQGEGVATARFYEACAMGRMPVIIGETMLLGEDQFDMSFVTQLSADLSVSELAGELVKLAVLPLSEVIQRGQKAHAYWENIVVDYFNDPTRFFIRWLEAKGLRK